MKKSGFTGEQIALALRQVESGTPVAEACRQMGCSEATFYIWKKRYGNLGATELRGFRQLRRAMGSTCGP
ncbi:MAG: transposase [Gammaproteobacteria bacterium]|nr:transposase [Gammaproteobacteria bacterium]